jgi:hypothetical protein
MAATTCIFYLVLSIEKKARQLLYIIMTDSSFILENHKTNNLPKFHINKFEIWFVNHEALFQF